MLLDDLEIKPLKRSYLVEVAFQADDRQLAQQVVNVISSEYMKFSMDTRRNSYALINTWLEGELQHLADKVQQSEMMVIEHGKKKDMPPSGRQR